MEAKEKTVFSLNTINHVNSIERKLKGPMVASLRVFMVTCTMSLKSVTKTLSFSYQHVGPAAITFIFTTVFTFILALFFLIRKKLPTCEDPQDERMAHYEDTIGSSSLLVCGYVHYTSYVGL